MQQRHEKCIRSLAPLRVSDTLEIELLRISARLDRPLSWVRRQALVDYVLAHGGSIAHDDIAVEHCHASQCALPERGTT